MAEQVTSDRRAAGRWHARNGAALAVRVTAALIPIALSILAACLVARIVGPQELGLIGWLLPGIVALAVVFVSERVCRRLLPLAGLLRLTLAFPDRAPSRLSIALRTGTTKQLQRWSAELEQSGRDLDAAEAAERVLTLAAALNAHDRRTRGHSERVRALTDLVAADLGLDQHDADRLRWAALLHDIGKLAVPAKILNKAGKPDAREWALLQRHPEEGARLVGPLAAWLGEWAAAVDSHHERFDGAGYPRGLAGTDIPLAGRIVAVTDSFETMTAVRSYKRAMSFGDARAELRRCAGTHFDPAIVRVMYGVSLPRLVWALGPFAALAHIPLVALLAQGSSLVPAIGEAAKTAALAGAASVALTGVVALEPVATTAAAATPAPGVIASTSAPVETSTSPIETTLVSAVTTAQSTTTVATPPPSTGPRPGGVVSNEDTQRVPPDSTAASAPPTTLGSSSSSTTAASTTVTTAPPTTKPTTPIVGPVASAVTDIVDEVTDVAATLLPVTPPIQVTLPEITVSPVTLPKLPL